MKRAIAVGILGVGLLIVGASAQHGCARSESHTTKVVAAATNPPATAAAPPATDVAVHGTIRSIVLPELESNLPPGEGRDVVLIACATCHTTRYIMHQPPLSRDAWSASVAKMRTTYSAPIPEERVKPIVDYLVAVRGAPTTMPTAKKQ